LQQEIFQMSSTFKRVKIRTQEGPSRRSKLVSLEGNRERKRSTGGRESIEEQKGGSPQELLTTGKSRRTEKRFPERQGSQTGRQVAELDPEVRNRKPKSSVEKPKNQGKKARQRSLDSLKGRGEKEKKRYSELIRGKKGALHQVPLS